MNHYPLDTKWLLFDPKISLDQFFQGPLVYKQAFRYGIILEKPATIKVTIKQQHSLVIEYKSDSLHNPDLIQLQIVQGIHNLMLTPEVQKLTGNHYRLSHTFQKRGIYDTHLLYDHNPIATYSVSVVKK